MKQKETKRILSNLDLEYPQKKKVIITISEIENSNHIFDLIREVVLLLSENSVEKDFDIKVPKWLDDIFDILDENIENNEYLFPRQIWVLKMKNRKWRWWSSKKLKYGFSIVLELKERCNYSEMIGLLMMLGIGKEKFYVEDDFFGAYKIEKLLT